MKRSISFSVLLLLGLMFSGCVMTQFLSHLPAQETPRRPHYLGMTVYNETGSGFSQEDWDTKFLALAEALKSFKECLGDSLSPVAYEKLRKLHIVITPPKTEEPSAFSFTPYIFIPINHFKIDIIRHEFLHPYLYYTGKYLWGDPFHRDPLFVRCG